MARILHDFKCSNEHTTERLVDNSENTIVCPHCNEEATRIITPVRCSLDPISGDFPGESMKWEKRRNDVMKKEQKTMRDHGTYR